MHGPDSAQTAAHHARHLGEFALKEDISQFGCDSESISERHHIAFLIVEEKDMITVRDALRPARAQVAE